MAPRKRQRPNPDEPKPASQPQPSVQPSQSSTSQASAASVAASSSSLGDKAAMPPPNAGSATLPLNSALGPASQASSGNQLREKSSWYGSWPRAPKSSASTQVARETILGGTLKPQSTSNLHRYDTKRNTDVASLFSASESAPVLPTLQENNPKPAPDDAQDTMKVDEPQKPSNEEPTKDTPINAAETAPDSEAPRPQTPQPATTPAGWLGWLGRSPAPPVSSAPPASASTTTKNSENGSLEQVATQKQDAQDTQGAASTSEPAKDASTAQKLSESLVERPKTATNDPKLSEHSGSWFSRGWSRIAAQPTTPTPATKPSETKTDTMPAKEQADAVMEDAPPATPAAAVSTDATPTPAPPPTAGSTWAFWSRESRPKTSSGTSTTKPEAGELAVIGDGSEAHPQMANSPTTKDMPAAPAANEPAKDARPAKGKPSAAMPIPGKNKRLRPQSLDMDLSSSPGPSSPTPKSSLPKGTDKHETNVQAESSQNVESSKKPSPSKETAAAKPSPPNLLLPSFNNTYHMKENPSILQQIAQLLLRTQQPAANHVFRAKETPKIKKALAIGVHGLFPATYLRPMIGQPTGTSIRFANLGAEAIRRWAIAHGSGDDCEIEKVALEGEGKIADRVNNLWKLLLNWIDHIRSADLIILACHSQGVPVAVMLLAKLIDLKVITDAKIGVCAMAGVSLGPFPDYRSSLLLGSAAELWEFSNPESELSQRYEHAIKEILDYGVRITFIGSIDDQLVPMESAVYSPANHPYIYRAVFIDGRIHAPDFIAHLVGFALKLRNLGVTDHGLIRELSIPLAGSLYGGEGHSRVYFDDQVYDLAVAHALETTNVGKVPCTVQKHTGLANPNPYHLPWIMRGLLEEDFVRTELSAETDLLLRQFDDWKPVTKALKDVKYRLEAVRSRL